MKTKLLRKIRSRIISVEFCGNIYADITYLDRDNEIKNYCTYGKGNLLTIIRNMFGNHFMRTIYRKITVLS